MGISKRLMMARDDLAYAEWVLQATPEEYFEYEYEEKTDDIQEYYSESVKALKEEVKQLEELSIKFGLSLPVSEKETDKGYN